MKNNTKLHIGAGIVVAALLFFWLGPRLASLSAGDVIDLTPQNPFLAALVLIVLFCSKNIFMMVPSVAIFVAAGALFPAVQAILICYIGLGLEFTIGYFVGQRMGTKKVENLIERRPKAENFFAIIERNSKAACFLTRLFPMPVPLDLISMFFGASAISFPAFLAYSLLGRSGIMIPWVIAGVSITNPFSREFLVPFAIVICITGSVFALGSFYNKKSGKIQSREKP